MRCTAATTPYNILQSVQKIDLSACRPTAIKTGIERVNRTMRHTVRQYSDGRQRALYVGIPYLSYAARSRGVHQQRQATPLPPDEV